MNLLVNGAHGVFTPQCFAETEDMAEWHVSDEYAEILRDGPNGYDYWDTWNHVLSTAYKMEGHDMLYLHQGESGDLFACTAGEASDND